MSKSREWPNNARAARDAAAEDAVRAIRALHPLVIGQTFTAVEVLRRQAIALAAVQAIAVKLQGVGAPIKLD
jgi:hypothetical protein